MRVTNSQIAKFSLVSMIGAIVLLQPVPEAHADISSQDKDVLEPAEKVAPTVEEIAKKLWGLAEVSLLEIKSSPYLK
jgi:hypothetical protein